MRQQSFTKRRTFFAVVSALLLTGVPSVVYAQGSIGEITGTVRDQNGALIRGAEVQIASDQQGWVRKTVTTDSGLYDFSAVPVGAYTVSVQSTGFKSYTQAGVTLQADLQARVDITLQVGSSSQTVNVTGSAALLETTSSTVQNVIDRERVQNLPLNGRDARQLIALVPGGIPQAPIDQFIASPSFAVNGARQDQVNFRLDGGEHMDSWFGSGLPYPNPDALQEFTVQTSNFSAKYGRNAGAIIDAVTRSGTNHFHGTLFEYLRNNAVDSRPYFATEVPIYRRNQFGATLGGPVLLPHYNGRDKTFWFFAWQTTRAFGAPGVNTYTTLDATQRQGILTSATPIINPQTGVAFPTNASGQYVIPQSQLSVPIQNFMNKYLPLPTGSTNLLTFPGGGSNDENQFVVRLDHRISASDSLMYRYFYDRPTGVVTYGAGIGPGLAWYDNSQVSIISNTLQETHVFSPSVVNYINFTLGNERHLLTPNTVFTWHDLGAGFLPADNSPQPDNAISVTGLFSTYSGFYWRNGRNNPDLSDELTLVRGKHTTSFGVDYQYSEVWNRTPFYIDGALSFNGQFTGSPAADFLLGDMNTFTQQSTNAEDLRQARLALYAEDDYKLTPQLTLNLGLRYEPYFPFFETLGRAGFWAPGQQSTRFPNAPPGLLFAFDNNPVIPNRNTIINKDWKNFAPRIGFAWDPTGSGKWSVRGGYGLFYNGLAIGIRTIRGIYNQPFTRVISVFSTNVSNPYLAPPFNGNAPFPYSAPTTPQEDLTVTFAPDANVVGWDARFATAYSQNYTLSLQRAIATNWLLQAAYIGNKGTKEFDSHNINPAIYIPGVGPDGQPLSTTANTQSRRIYPTIGNLEIESSEAYSSYNSLQLGLDKRMSQGLTIMASYVYSRLLGLNVPLGEGGGGTRDPLDQQLDYGIMPEDLTHRFVGSYIYQLPKRNLDSKALSFFANGWGSEGIATWQSGVPFTVRSGVDNSFSGVGQDTADQIGNPAFSGGRSLPAKLGEWFNTAAFVHNAIGTFGDTGINTLRGPRFTDVDFAITKSSAITENQSVMFRAEFFNVFNHPNFGVPNSTVSAGSLFGVINSNVGSPRNIEFSLRYSF
jgi:outer membrane receptor protein involved in Fe transport